MVFDGSNLFWRGYHGLLNQRFEFAGKPTWGIFGTINAIATSIKQHNPTHVVVVFDLGKSAYRLKLWPEYKAGRTHSASDGGYIDFEDALHQLSQTQKTLETLGVQLWRDKTVEADDVLAAIMKRFYDEMDSTVLVSGDKDFRQLIDDKTIVVHPSLGKKMEESWTVEKVIDHYGIHPNRLPEIWALCGDKVDNIPGIMGVGEKTAIKLIKNHGNLTNVLLESDKAKGKADDVELFYKLVTIEPDLCDLGYLNLDDIEFKPVKPTDDKADEVQYVFDELGFEAFTQRWMSGTLWSSRGIRLRDLKNNSEK